MFEFISTGKYGEVRKRIIFHPMDWEGVYSLAFGNIGPAGEIDDHTITDNGDRNKILATIARVVDYYTICYPRRWIYFRGNSKEKTRLYRMAVGLHLKELSSVFEIFGEVEGSDFIPFHKNMEISAFLIRRKLF